MVSIVEIYARGNRAVDVNQPTGLDIHITNDGSSWLWTAFSIFGVVSLIHIFFYFRHHKNNLSQALFYVSPLIATLSMTYAYFTMASNLGWTGIATEFNHVTVSSGGNIRQIFYARYIGWFFAWPALLLAIAFSSNNKTNSFGVHALSSWILIVLSADIFVISLLIGALIESSYKWGYFTFAIIAQLFSIFLVSHRVYGKLSSPFLSKIGAGLVFLLWILYPIAWALSEGGNVIEPDSEQAFYGVLDVLTFAVIPLLFIHSGRKSSTAPATSPAVAPASNKPIEPETARNSGETIV
ncbi:opsin family protein [Ascoidea rubescens DSM 1968]|uniref:Family A G protein-coupled receptor-like protein n=1 Tax=Ascoidea rubescens DSM 1968 TaxID=1344418 RepID=A0A1D2VLB6_9ASCO|nr:family A G protein-coupled receptor-like protein [Ascoidea rubescens DSM 1968]ODV62406.1 family A G protein-coupled receptor-like protein [Ascoidea rubescens DSM 1968]